MNDQATMTRMRRQRRLMRLVNVPMRRLLALPFPTPLSARLMLLTLIGRKTGRVYRQPVSYVVDGDTLLTPGGGQWTHNLVDGQPVQVRLRGRNRQAVPELVRNRAEVDRLLATLLTGNPRAKSFMPFVDHNGRVDASARDSALAHGFCIVRWRLDTVAATT